jgi:methyl-accepting chemotaxis protein
MTLMENLRGKRKRVMPDNRSPKDQTFNVEKLGQDVEDAMQRVHPYDDQTATQQLEVYIPRKGPTPLPTVEMAAALPDYVEHHTNVDDIGKLSAAAVVQQYETAAKTIELMGKELIEAAQQAEKMATEVKEAIAYIQEVAQKYRDEAKVIFDRIEKASLLTSEVRATCDDMRKKIENHQTSALIYQG